MAKMTEQEVREKITQMFLFTYLPKIKGEVQRLMNESESKAMMAREISMIVGSSVGMEVGQLHIARPTNDLIDSLVKLYVQETEKEQV